MIIQKEEFDRVILGLQQYCSLIIRHNTELQKALEDSRRLRDIDNNTIIELKTEIAKLKKKH
jgi:hypothetical protein